MKISIGGVQIVDTSDGSGSAVSGLLPEIERLLEEVAPIRAAARVILDRGNKRTEIPFRISLPCVTPAGSVYFAFALEASIPNDGPLIITPNKSTATITIPGKLRSIRSSIIGSRLTLDVIFIGGAATLAGFGLITEAGQQLTDETGNPLID